MATPLIEITGTYRRTLHRAEDSDFTIGVLEDGTKVLGSIGEDILQPGMEYQFYGKWDSHPTHGNQFKFFQVILARPATRDGTIAYLTKFCSGIGPRIALKLWDVFGSNAISALRTDPMRVSMECPGLRIDVATDAAKVLTEIAELEATRIDLMGLFKGRGFTGTLVDDCIKKWGIHAPNRIRHDPFRLMVEGFGGCGFARCDRMYQDLGLPLGRLKRQLLCLWYAMKSNSHGHTWFVRAEIAEEAARVIGGAEFEEEKVIRFGIRARWLAQKGEFITLREYADQEEQIAARLLDLVTWDRAAEFEPLWPDETSIPGISSHQAEQVAKATRRPVAILVGGPGTGKCLGLGTPVLLHDGTIKPVEIIQAGDVLMGPDSQPRKVLSTSHGHGPLYQVNPVKGEPWVCNDAHILTLIGSRKVIGKIRDVSVLDYLRELSARVPHADSWKLLKTGVDFKNRDLPVPPYLVGLWLGDGTRGMPAITNSSLEIIEYCRHVAVEMGLRCTVKPIEKDNTFLISFSHPDSAGGRSVNQFRTFLTERCHTASQKKCIPHEYLASGRESRLQLLAGILDTDGELSGANTFIVGVSGDRYRDGVLFLCRSLGFAANWRKTNKQYYRDRPDKRHYTITISGDTCHLPLLRHKPSERRQVKNHLVTGFSLEPIGDGDYYGFTLDGDGRFLLGDFTVTHNTHTAGALIRKTLENVKPWDVAVCAPTGKAAVRITESMRNALRGTGIEIEGTTIHRLLGVGRNGHDGKGWGFVHGPDNPLPVKLVVVDEFSMVDDSLLCSLLRACAPGTHLLFIGDPGQLPPVGHGAPLRDMLASGIPSGELTEIHRHGGRIAHVCQDIRNGRPFSPSEGINEDAGENYFHQECANSSVACHWLRKFVQALPEGCDRMWDLQVLCAVNDDTPVSRTALNKGLQSILNPKGEPALKGFRVGDKSICLSNGFYPKTVLCPDCESSNVRRLSRDEMRQLSGDENSLCCVCGAMWWEDKPEASGCFVANGEVGVLRSAGEKVLVFEFSDPHRIISAAGEAIESFALAYAITTHKSQGSQAKYIIFMVDESTKARWVGCRELVMTGISRASKVAITIGQMRILQQDCRKAALPMRRTALQELISEKLQPCEHTQT